MTHLAKVFRRVWKPTASVVIVLAVMVISAVSLSAGSKPAWIELRSPHFIVITNAGEGQARKTATQFEMVRAVLRSYFGQKQESTDQPVIILAAKDESTLKALVPEFWEKKGAAHPAGIYLSGTDADYIGIRLDVSLNQEAYDSYATVYHEYAHYVTRQSIASMPLWMVEGLAEFYGHLRITNKEVAIGAPATSDLIILHQQSLLPVSTLLAIDSSSPYYHEENKTSIFYAESWALTHYLVTRDWKENKHRLNDFVNLLKAGMDAKEAASQTIGDVSELDGALRKYINNRMFTAMRLEPHKVDDSGFRVRPLTDAEALAARADFMAHDRHYSEARQMLEEALKADPKLAIAYDALSYLALQLRNSSDAENWASHAVALDPQDYRANYYYAWSLMSGDRSDEASLAKAEACLRVVMKVNPEFVPAYDAMAYVLAVEGGKEKLDEAYMMVLQAITREPGNLHYRLRAVGVLQQQRRGEDAVRAANLALQMAKTPEEKQSASATLAGAQQFQESWEKYKEMQAREISEEDDAETPRLMSTGPTREVSMMARVMMLTNPQGVDFGSYLSQEVIPKVQQEWGARVRRLGVLAATKKATAMIEFAIEKDGSVSSVILKQSTQEPKLDAAVREAIQQAAPFAPLPAKFRGKAITLRFHADYNPDLAESGTAAQDAADKHKK